MHRRLAETKSKDLRETDRPAPSENIQTASHMLPGPMSIPEALSRLAQNAGLPSAGSNGLAFESAENVTGPETLAILSEELGIAFRFETLSPKKTASLKLPVIVMTPKGGSYLVTGDKNQIKIIGRDGSKQTNWHEIIPHLSTRVLVPDLHESVSKEFTTADDNSARSSAYKQETQATSVLEIVGQTLWKDNRELLIQLGVASTLSNLFLIALPLFIMSVYDRVIPHSAFESLQTLAIGITIILAADLGIRFARLKFIDAIGLNLSARVQRQIYQRILMGPYAKRPKSSSTIAGIQTEIESFSLILPEVIASMVADLAFTFIVLFVIASIGGPVVFGPILGIVCVASVIASVARATAKENKMTVGLRSAVIGQVNESIDSLSSVKSAGAEMQMISKYERLGAVAAAQLHKSRHRSRFATNAASLIVQLTVVLTVILGVMRISEGLMSIGSMAAITILTGRAIMPIAQLADNTCRLFSLRKIIDGVLSDIPAPENGVRDKSTSRRKIQGQISLKNVSYTPPETERPTLNDVSLNIEAGERIALIGRNGCGKSTLMKLMACLHTPQSGKLLFDGYDSSQYAPRMLRWQIGFMEQDIVLMKGSIRDNICLGLNKVDDQKLVQAANLAGLGKFIKNHPDGFDANVGPRGEFLSAGQRQALALARVLMRPHPIMILDEPTSLMDQSAEAHVISTLKALPRDVSIIVSTHRLKLLEAVDRVITMDEGKIVGDTPKEALLKSQSAKTA